MSWHFFRFTPKWKTSYDRKKELEQQVEKVTFHRPSITISIKKSFRLNERILQKTVTHHEYAKILFPFGPLLQ